MEGVECCYERNGGEQDGRNSEDRMERADTCLVCGAHSRGLAATLDYIRNWLLVSNHSGTGGWWPEASYRALNCPRSSAAASLVSLSPTACCCCEHLRSLDLSIVLFPGGFIYHFGHFGDSFLLSSFIHSFIFFIFPPLYRGSNPLPSPCAEQLACDASLPVGQSVSLAPFISFPCLSLSPLAFGALRFAVVFYFLLPFFPPTPSPPLVLSYSRPLFPSPLIIDGR